MPELAMVEVLAWPALAAGFGWYFGGRKVAIAAFPAVFVLLCLALWFGSPPGGGNRAMLGNMAEAALWALGLGVPAFLYARVIARARRAARERDE